VIFCEIAIACDPPCPNCQAYNVSTLSCQTVCFPGQSCCDIECINPDTTKCCNFGNGRRCPKDYTCCTNVCCDPNQCQICNGDSYECASKCGPNQRCCHGECYNPDANETCCDGKEIYNYDTKKCCGEGTGKTCPKNKICCGSNCCDPNKECCDGSCVNKCKLEPEDNSCAGSDIDCLEHCLHFPLCISVYRVYYGGGTNSCSGIGCPGGHCHEGTKDCYITYPSLSMSVPLSVCDSSGTDCYIDFLPTRCYWCYPDLDRGVTETVPFWDCSGE